MPATHAAARVAMPLPAGHDDCVGCGCVPGSWAVVALVRVRLCVFARGGAWVPSYVASKEVHRHRGLTTLLLWVHVCVAVRVSVCVCVTSEQSATKTEAVLDSACRTTTLYLSMNDPCSPKLR